MDTLPVPPTKQKYPWILYPYKLPSKTIHGYFWFSLIHQIDEYIHVQKSSEYPWIFYSKFLQEKISMDIFDPMDALKKIEIYVLKVSTDYLSIIYKETNGE